MSGIRNTVLGTTNGRPLIGDIFLQDHIAPSLVFIHGFKGFKDWGSWNQMAEFFYSRGFNFVKFNLSHNGGNIEQVEDFPDLEAFGQNNFSLELSDIQQVLDFISNDERCLQRIDKDRIALLGHSRGGALAMLSSLEDDRISALCTLNAVVDLRSWMDSYDEKRWRQEGVVIIRNGRTDQDMPLYYQFMADFLANISRFDLIERCRSIEQPTLLIHCEDDPVVPVGQVMAAHERIDGSQVFLLKKGGHTLGASQPNHERDFPPSLRSACERIDQFFKDLDWI
jgi:pimeloyl-ACP methyl ester carboxylesterase